jgi:hypothetical protein
MAIDPGASTAYAAQRYAPRPTRNGAVVGREMTAKQRDFIVALALDVRRLQAASLLLAPLPGGVSVKDRDMIAADMIAPATIVREVQATLNRTDIGARTLITNMIAQRDRARADFRAKQAKYGKTASSDASAAAPLTPGTYRTPDGRVYRVVPSRTSGRMYASVFTPGDTPESGSWDYAPGATHRITLAHRLTEEQEREFGRAYGWCCRCGRLLTDPDSVAAGIGPICAGK